MVRAVGRLWDPGVSLEITGAQGGPAKEGGATGAPGDLLGTYSCPPLASYRTTL